LKKTLNIFEEYAYKFLENLKSMKVFRRIIDNFLKDVINKRFLLRIIGQKILKNEVDEFF
jgi:hypothetical protein